MMSFQNTEYLISVVLLFFAYVFSITLSGTVQAYVAEKMDDELAADLGYTEFNPFLFINLFDIIWFVAFKIMIGRPVPIELTHGIDRTRSWWRLRIFALFASRPLCNLAIAAVASLIGLVICKPIFLSVITATDPMALKTSMSSLPHLMCLFCLSLVWANIFLATFECCRQAIHCFVLYKMEKDFMFIEHADYIMALGPLLLWLFFHKTIINIFTYVVDCLVFGVSKACGVI
jgi:hypothetical protein